MYMCVHVEVQLSCNACCFQAAARCC